MDYCLLYYKSSIKYTTRSNEILNNQIETRNEEEKELILKCTKLKKELENKEFSFKVKTGEGDKVFGSISSKAISEELLKNGW